MNKHMGVRLMYGTKTAYKRLKMYRVQNTFGEFWDSGKKK